jgi:hypothetical protein
MKPIDADTGMIVAGIVLSLIAALELYSEWKRLGDGPTDDAAAS